jgi:hypothetical protein
MQKGGGVGRSQTPGLFSVTAHGSSLMCQLTRKRIQCKAGHLEPQHKPLLAERGDSLPHGSLSWPRNEGANGRSVWGCQWPPDRQAVLGAAAVRPAAAIPALNSTPHVLGCELSGEAVFEASRFNTCVVLHVALS